MEELEKLQTLRAELQEAIEAASLLLDNRVYTNESYFALVQAVGCAKVAVMDEKSDEAALEKAHTSLCETVDAMTLRPTEKKAAVPKKKRNAAPVLILGAFCGGLLLGKKLTSKRKKQKRNETR